MFRSSNNRHALLPLILLFILSFAACGPGGEGAPSNTAASNTTASNTAASGAASPAASATPPGQPASATARAKLNLNTASEKEFLGAIPGMGNRMVGEFLEYRPYRSIQQFRREIGKYVSPEQVAEYEKYVYVPIDANESDAATLQQIPGLDAKEAEALIAARPYASNEAFLGKLAGNISEEEMAVARAYLGGR